MKLELINKKIEHFFKNRLSLLNSFEYNTDESNYSSGYGVFEDSKDPINLVFSIPQNSHHFFFTLSEADSDIFVSELSSIQWYCENMASICLHHSIPTDDEYLNSKGYFGYIFISPKHFHESLDVELNINNDNYKAIAVVPITQKELTLKRERGIDGLFDYWDSIDKDIVSFND